MDGSTGSRRRTYLFKETHLQPLQRALLLTAILLFVNLAGWVYMLEVARFEHPILLFIIVLAAFTTVLSGAPLIMFLSLGWFTRYSEFQNSLKGAALVAYLQRFWSTSLIHSLEDEKLISPGNPADDWRSCSERNPLLCERLFARIYHEQYGLVPFVVPFIVLLSVTYAAAALVASNYLVQSCDNTFQLACTYKIDSRLLVSSVAGAFMFVVSDSVLSIRRKSLNISDVYWYSLRLFLAIPLALVIANVDIADSGTHIAMAFRPGHPAHRSTDESRAQAGVSSTHPAGQGRREFRQIAGAGRRDTAGGGDPGIRGDQLDRASGHGRSGPAFNSHRVPFQVHLAPGFPGHRAATSGRKRGPAAGGGACRCRSGLPVGAGT